MPLTVAEVAAVTGGTLTTPAVATHEVTAVLADSRRAATGTLFVALPGERVDGHDFVAGAVAAGAVAALTTRPLAGVPCVVVDDGYRALGVLARRVVDDARAGGLRVVGLTGSAGKTTTKDLLAAVLERTGPTVAPPGSLNNELGLPLTACRVEPTTRFLVAEMGARGIGHIAYLCGITPPDVGLELNVGHAHLGEFGSQQAVATAKGELVEALAPDGVAVLNAGDPLVTAMAVRTVARTLFYRAAPDPEADRRGGPEVEVEASAHVADDLDRWSFTLRTPEGTRAVTLQTSGRHQVANAVAAAAAATAVGVDLDTVAAGLSAAAARSRWRMELHERSDGVLVVNDAYNANPESVRAALDSLARLGARRRARWPGARTWAVLGAMLELGAESETAHAEVGAYAVRSGVSRLVVVGQNARSIADGALAAAGSGAGPTSRQEDGLVLADVLPDRAAAAAHLADRLRPGDVVLVKASRSVGLETVAEQLVSAESSADRIGARR